MTMTLIDVLLENIFKKPQWIKLENTDIFWIMLRTKMALNQLIQCLFKSEKMFPSFVQDYIQSMVWKGFILSLVKNIIDILSAEKIVRPTRILDYLWATYVQPCVYSECIECQLLNWVICKTTVQIILWLMMQIFYNYN